ncbi:MAG: polyprenyl synthetase family protein [Planctomycetota bacterium]
MKQFVQIPPEHEAVWERVLSVMTAVTERFDAQLASDLPAVEELIRHVERFRGKMLRPMLTVLSAEAVGADGGEPDVVTSAAVVEMVHMATLVHDDVLDEASLRRRGETINALRGNEAAVILGDYLIAGAYHLCSQMSDQARALLIGRVAMDMCSGELLQLSRRGDFSLDEQTYFRVLDGKTAALVGVSCRLGAMAGSAEEPIAHALEVFGRRLGVAFQIQDDLIDLTASDRVAGKSTGRDVSKGKVTLPLIHHLEEADPEARGRTLRVMDDAARREQAADLREFLELTGSIGHARGVAERLVDEARQELARLPESPARDMLGSLATASITRNA